MTTTIFLADDHAVVRDGLRLMLETEPDFRVIGEAGTGRAVIRQITNHCPDVIIMDIAMPELNGIDATRQVCQICPGTKVIILSMHISSSHVHRALHAGAHGYVLKSSVGAELINAIKTVLSGYRHLSQKVSEQVIDNYISRDRLDTIHNPLDQLSPREREILQLVVESKSSAEIANLLHISPSSVDTYRSRLMQKLDIHNLPELVKFAIQYGLTSLD